MEQQNNRRVTTAAKGKGRVTNSRSVSAANKKEHCGRKTQIAVVAATAWKQ